MISLEKIRQLDLNTTDLTDEELKAIRQSFYDLGQLIFEDWCSQKFGSKNRVGLLTDTINDHTM